MKKKYTIKKKRFISRPGDRVCSKHVRFTEQEMQMGQAYCDRHNMYWSEALRAGINKLIEEDK